MPPHDIGPGRDLRRIERWMLETIAHPGNLHEALASPEVREQIDTGPGDLGVVLRGSGALSPEAGLGIYRRAYAERLLDSLRKEYPGLCYALTPPLFDRFALEYVRAYPPRSTTLADLGADFPRHLRETRPRDGAGRTDWTDFVVDLAALERACFEAFDARGAEERGVPGADAVATMPWDRLAAARFEPAGTLRLLACRFPVHLYLAAVRAKKGPPLPAADDVFLAVCRRDYRVTVCVLPRRGFASLRALAAGSRVAAAFPEAATRPEGARATISGWIAKGFFRGMRPQA